MIAKDMAAEIADMIRNSLMIQNEIEFGYLKGKAPKIDFYPDEKLFFDSDKYEIHLGIYGILNLFTPEDEKVFVNAVNYARGHESEHVRSTATIPYRWGIKRGIETILEYISSKEERSKRRFRGDKDYEDFANRILPGMDIYISYKMLGEIVSAIANSLEDGRIERIRSFRLPGFKKMMTFFRGRFWLRNTRAYKPWSQIEKSPSEILAVMTDQILTLSTCQIYSRGFAKAYAGTPMMDIIRPLKPHITKAVMANKTRALAKEVVKICELLAPYIYEAVKLSKKDLIQRQILEALLKELLKDMAGRTPSHDLSEKDEEEAPQSANTVFPSSDLVITVDDETYDKLMENAQASSEDGSGLMIRREHPKEDDVSKGPDPDENESSVPGEEKKETPKEIKSGSGSPKEDGSSSGSSAEGESSEETKDGSGHGCSETEKGSDKDPRRSSGNSGGTSEKMKISAESSAAEGEGKKGGKTSASGAGGGEGDMEAVEKAMKEAAEKTNELASKQIDTINRTRAHVAKTSGKVVQNGDHEVSPKDVKDICSRFKEVRRKYKLKDKLPPVLASEGRTLYRKNRRYFKSLSTPNVSFLDSGMVDPSRIYGLSFGDTEIFRKKGMDRKFDGCIYMLIDNSGSMDGSKRVEACKAAALIEESYRGLVPIKIVAFDSTGTIVHEVVKGFDEQQNLNCCWNFCLHGRSGCGNEDQYDILIAQRELLMRPERKKLMIVLSDGAPSSASATKRAIDETRKKGIKVCGIYFEEGDVEDADGFFDMYGHKDAIACPLSELSKNLEMIAKRFSRS